ncbi:hypothetical protein AN958_11855 [Leucoagaricus sp. SymC.cos]|nr:hypothetical protein AN958_11855 [Leucoagaricus sp. SymC.cos]
MRPFSLFAEEGFTNLTGAAGLGKYLVNILAPLKSVPGWLPGAGFKQDAKKMRKQLEMLMEEPYQETVKNMEAGTVPRSFVVDSLERYAHGPDAM